MSLIVSIFLLTVFTTLISTLGAQTINNLLWTLSGGSPLSRRVSNLRKEILQLRKGLTQTSSQDAFARWAKLRRTVDKKTAELESLQAQLQSQKAAFNAKVGVLRWVLTSGLRLSLMAWYSRVPVFWMPKGAVPGYVEWGLSFPRAPKGAVSIQVWSFAVGVVITGLVEILKGVMMSAKVEAAGEKEKVAEKVAEKVKTEL